jgi:vacuolar-type H+-ATPase subunit H
MRNIDEILENMDEVLDKAMQVPFSNKKSLVDVERIRELVEEVRFSMPDAFKQAKKITQDRKDIVAEAKTEADTIIKRAEERAKQLTSQQEVARLAQQRANEIMASAQTKSKELRTTTNDYIDSTLSKVEELLSHDLVNIKKARSALKANK